jgi:hypothetical protein
MENTFVYSLETVLSNDLKKQINESVRFFIRRLPLNQPELPSFILELGQIYVTVESKLNDNFIFNICCNCVENHYGVPLNMIISKTRKREIVEKRQMLQTVVGEFTKLSLSSIGEYTGGKDHATVLHAKKTISNLVATDRVIAFDYESISGKIKETLKAKENEQDED